MSLGVVGRKIGMTRIFTETGESIPVTVLHVQNNQVTQIKTAEIDGYSAVQVTAGLVNSNGLNKPQTGHYKKSNVSGGRGLWEFRIDDEEIPEVGQAIDVDIFEVGSFVNVTGTSIGKGFAGVIKRHNFSGQDRSHGNSLSHRAHGATGQCQDPGRVFKGKKMAGHMGDEQVTQKNLQVIKIDMERHLILVRGSVPGSKGGDVIVKVSTKPSTAIVKKKEEVKVSSKKIKADVTDDTTEKAKEQADEVVKQDDSEQKGQET